MVFAVIVGLALIAAIITPFFVGEGGPLQAGSAISDPDHLERQKKAVLKRYIDVEKAEADGDISKTEWARKKQFLTNRYIDASRRIDFLRANKKK